MASRRKTYTQHHHGCTQCRRRYVCACPNPAVANRCNVCISGRESERSRAWDPRPCCSDARPIINRDVLKSYKLAPSDKTWWKCPVCARTFPCHPDRVGASLR